MKRLLLSSIITLMSFNLSAVEHVIGVGGFYGNNKTKLRHSSIIDYENPNFDPNKPIDNTNKERLKYALTDDISNNNSGYNLNLEYQFRSDIFAVGFGFDNNKVYVKPNYQNLDNINYTVNTPYLMAMISPYSNKYFSIWLGLSLGTGFLKALSENKTQFNSTLFIDGEYNINKKFMLFSRFSLSVTEKYNLTYDTDLHIENIPFKNPRELYNWLNITPQNNYVKINLGVRYKI